MCFGYLKCRADVLFNFRLERLRSSENEEIQEKRKYLLPCVDESELSVSQRVQIQQYTAGEPPRDKPPRLLSVNAEFEWQRTKLMELGAVSQGARTFVDENVGTLVDRLNNALEVVDQCEKKVNETAELVAKRRQTCTISKCFSYQMAFAPPDQRGRVDSPFRSTGI
jgi:hypothetical protein